jgi:hypothetical protein
MMSTDRVSISGSIDDESIELTSWHFCLDVPASHRLARAGSEGYIWPAEEDEHESDDEDDFDDPYEHPENKKLLQLGQ